PLMSRCKEISEALPVGTTVSAEIFASQLVAWFIRQSESMNQAHALALCANRLLDSPVIKRDLCYRGFWSIATLVQLVEGFGEADKTEMLEDLTRKSKAPAGVGLQRLRYLIDA